MKTLLKILLSVAGAAVAVQDALVGVVEAMSFFRRKFFAGRPPDTFPWKDRPEVELESDDVRLKVYTHYEPLYEAMLEEIEHAEERIFVETFIWQDDGWGSRLLDALTKKACEGGAVYAVFDELADLGQPAAFKRFPGGINLLRFRRFSGPGSIVNPRNAHREHRKLLTVDGRVAFAEFWEIHGGEDLPPVPPLRGRHWDPSTGFLVNDPYHLMFPIRDSYLSSAGGVFRRTARLAQGRATMKTRSSANLPGESILFGSKMSRIS